MPVWVWIVIVVVVLGIVALAGWGYMRKRRSEQLRDRFGPEYDRAVSQYGNRGRAEPELAQREKRVESFDLRPLPQAQRDRYVESWRSVQARFVDDPSAAVSEADGLVGEVMEARGYPVGDFEQRAADISVDHPDVVENYRAAHDIALRRDRGEASTEDLRTAMIHYRALFEDLLETPESEQAEVGQ